MKKVKFRVLGEAIKVNAVIKRQGTLFPKMVRRVPTLEEMKRSGTFGGRSRCK